MQIAYSSEVKIARKNKIRFTQDEVKVLIAEAKNESSLLNNPSSLEAMRQKKEATWGKILLKVQSVSTTKRTIADLKSKWQKLQSEVKHKESRRMLSCKKTGGGQLDPEDSLNSTEMDILDTIPSEKVHGLKNSFDVGFPCGSQDDCTVQDNSEGKENKGSASINVIKEMEMNMDTSLPSQRIIMKALLKTRKVIPGQNQLAKESQARFTYYANEEKRAKSIFALKARLLRLKIKNQEKLHEILNKKASENLNDNFDLLRFVANGNINLE